MVKGYIHRPHGKGRGVCTYMAVGRWVGAEVGSALGSEVGWNVGLKDATEEGRELDFQ